MRVYYNSMATVMSDSTVHRTGVGTSRLWATLSGLTGARKPVTRVSRPRRVARAATPAVDFPVAAPRKQHGDEQAVHEGPTRSQYPDLGYSRQLSSRYDVGQQIGSGGNATVYVVQDKFTCKVFACKSIPKAAGPQASREKAAAHISAIKQEIQVLKQLRGSLNVACLEEVYEDDTHVHLILEYCRGGELAHRIGSRHYSERTVCTLLVWPG